ncbi:hypothetical protein ACROYT_G042224 [Oculina patagonica]
MREPVQTKCGHRFCKHCLEQSMKGNRECPIDRHPLDPRLTGEIYPDLAIERSILDLKVKCPNDKTGCQWIGELRGVQKHIDFCKRYPCSCPQKCGKNNIPREELNCHIENDCPLTKLDCSYVHVGCKEKVARKALSRHLKDKMEVHLNLACGTVQELKKRLKPKFMWKLDHFTKHMDLAKYGGKKFYTSPPFSTGAQGYKMQMTVYPNGAGLGEHTHLSVYANLVQGEYDAILPWPFKLEVTFTLIDQQADPDERRNVQFILPPAIATHLSQNTFKRPSDKPNTGFGCPKFVSHEILNTRRYIVDDTIFIHLEVDMLNSLV